MPDLAVTAMLLRRSEDIEVALEPGPTPGHGAGANPHMSPSSNISGEGSDQGRGILKALTKKAAISARETAVSGQYFKGSSEQPLVISSAYSCSIQLAAQ
jgi:hypothetical protein